MRKCPTPCYELTWHWKESFQLGSENQQAADALTYLIGGLHTAGLCESRTQIFSTLFWLINVSNVSSNGWNSSLFFAWTTFHTKVLFCRADVVLVLLGRRHRNPRESVWRTYRWTGAGESHSRKYFQIEVSIWTQRFLVPCPQKGEFNFKSVCHTDKCKHPRDICKNETGFSRLSVWKAWQKRKVAWLFCFHRYMRQVLDETLRCSTLAPYAARFQDMDIELGGHKLPAGVS